MIKIINESIGWIMICCIWYFGIIQYYFLLFFYRKYRVYFDVKETDDGFAHYLEVRAFSKQRAIEKVVYKLRKDCIPSYHYKVEEVTD